MAEASDLRSGNVIELDGELYRVLEYQHQKIARSGANVKTKLKNVETGTTISRTFGADDQVHEIRLESRPVQFLYRDDDMFHFMDQETYEQTALHIGALGDAEKYLTEGMTLQLAMYERKPIQVNLPTTVDLEVVDTIPGVKGDTATGATKPATVETGLEVQVPLFVDRNDVIRVDTRSDEYVTRVN